MSGSSQETGGIAGKDGFCPLILSPAFTLSVHQQKKKRKNEYTKLMMGHFCCCFSSRVTASSYALRPAVILFSSVFSFVPRNLIPDPFSQTDTHTDTRHCTLTHAASSCDESAVHFNTKFRADNIDRMSSPPVCVLCCALLPSQE